jgi:hypothetical protein
MWRLLNRALRSVSNTRGLAPRRAAPRPVQSGPVSSRTVPYVLQEVMLLSLLLMLVLVLVLLVVVIVREGVSTAALSLLLVSQRAPTPGALPAPASLVARWRPADVTRPRT